MATFLKEPNPPTVEATDELQSRVAAMLRDIEAGGIDAVRRYSRELDGWDPESFVVSDAEFERARDELDAGADGAHRLRAGAGARLRRGPARHAHRPARRACGPGVVARASPHPRRRGRRLRAGRPLPDARVVVHDRLRGEGRRRRARRRLRAAAARRRDPSRDALRDARRRARTRSSASAASRRSPRWPSALERRSGRSTCSSARATRTSPRPSASCSAASGIDLLAGPTEIARHRRRDRRPASSSPPTCSARPSTGRRRPRASSRSARTSAARVIARGRRRCCGRGRPRDVAGAAWRDHGWVVVAGDDDEADRARRRGAPTSTSRCRSRRRSCDCTSTRLRNYGSLFLGDAGDRRLRRQGGRDQPRPADRARGARYTGGLWVGKFLKTLHVPAS